MKSRNYQSSIPANATEVVHEFYIINRAKKSAFFILNGENVGFREWENTGELSWEHGIKSGKKHGREYQFWPNGLPLEMTPFRNGIMHGIGKQWSIAFRKGS